jgi:GNAT superfamily N-acetyltransferase
VSATQGTAALAWRLRRATGGDAAELARLSAELGYAVGSDEIARRLSALDAESELILVAERVPGQLGAWLHAAQRLSLEAGARVEIMGLVVDASCRRQHLGAALVADAELWARARNAPLLVVRSNIVRNESHAFYPALGFARGKTQHVYSKRLDQ